MPRTDRRAWIDAAGNIHWYTNGRSDDDYERVYPRPGDEGDKSIPKNTPNSKGHSVRFSGSTQGDSDRDRSRSRSRSRSWSRRRPILAGVHNPRQADHTKDIDRSCLNLEGRYGAEGKYAYCNIGDPSTKPKTALICKHGVVLQVCGLCGKEWDQVDSNKTRKAGRRSDNGGEDDETESRRGRSRSRSRSGSWGRKRRPSRSSSRGRYTGSSYSGSSCCSCSSCCSSPSRSRSRSRERRGRMRRTRRSTRRPRSTEPSRYDRPRRRRQYARDDDDGDRSYTVASGPGHTILYGGKYDGTNRGGTTGNRKYRDGYRYDRYGYDEYDEDAEEERSRRPRTYKLKSKPTSSWRQSWGLPWDILAMARAERKAARQSRWLWDNYGS